MPGHIAKTIACAITFSAALAVGAAYATTLSGVHGDVLLNRGDGFKPVNGGAVLKNGDAVMVRPGGGAQIAYSDGCNISVLAGAVVAVGSQSPCAAKASFQKPYYSGVNDALDPREARPTDGTLGDASIAGAPISSAAMSSAIGIGVSAAAGLAAGVYASRRDNNQARPASP